MASVGKKPVSLELLDEVADEIRLRLKAVTRIKKVMEKRDLEVIQAMGRPMVTRGLADVDRFIRSCKKELGEL